MARDHWRIHTHIAEDTAVSRIVAEKITGVPRGGGGSTPAPPASLSSPWLEYQANLLSLRT